MHVEKITRDFLIQVGELDPDPMTTQRRAVLDSMIAAGRYTEATEDEIADFDAAFYADFTETPPVWPHVSELCRTKRQPYSTELTPEGEQSVIPGCERQTTKKNPQGELFS